MAVTRFEIRRREAYCDGAPFGEAGAYERLDGVAHFAVEPAHAANREIVDLARAERGADGLVHFEADFVVLQPADPAKANGALLFDVSNRGGLPAATLFNSGVPRLEISEEIPPANGFLYRHGFTVAWCGWQWDVPRMPGLVGLSAPSALSDDGQPVRGEVCVQIVRNTAATTVRLCDVLGLIPFQVYRPLDLNDPGARMTVQDWPDGPRAEIPRGTWRFARAEGGQLVPDGESVWLEGGFAPGKVYDLFYTTGHCPVVGTGLLAVRDFVSALRFDGASPCAGAATRALGFGISQSGRFLRTFLYHGLNVDEAGRQVFDGLLPFVAGGRRGEFNHRFAQPSVEVTPSFGHLPPWSDTSEGGHAGLLDKQRSLGGLPKVMYVNSAAEYWRGDAALAHILADGSRDLALPEDIRAYLFASTQHGPGVWPLLSKVPIPDGPVLRHWMNAVDQRPMLRAALTNLDRWVAAGVEPPPSAVPSVTDGTVIERAAALDAIRIPGAARPDPAKMRFIQVLDLGPETSEGIGRVPAVVGASLLARVSAIDGDGNEVAGVRHPDVAVPVATYTGWNPRHPVMGAADQLVRYMGSTFPFAATKAAREATSDPRPSVEERYAGRDDYEARVRAAATGLLEQRWLLDEDLEQVVRRALAKYDAVAAGLPVVPPE